MPTPRKQQVFIEETPYYHCMSRCVRRAFLCGRDINGKSYEHRRGFIENRVRLLSSIFSIDICSYAVMSNHYHLVVKIGTTDEWSVDKVIKHWLILHKGPLLVQRYQQGQSLDRAELKTVMEIAELWRTRLQSLSWFFKCLNEPIARQANQEDKCTGHFWESRFISQPLLTEEAVLSCMAYVDLNPIRAKMAKTPEESDHTSIKERMVQQFDLAEAIREQPLANPFDIPITALARFEDVVTSGEQTGILYSLKDYLTLVDWTGRAIRRDKRGAIDAGLPPILSRLGVSSDRWLSNSQHFEKFFRKRFRRAA